MQGPPILPKEHHLELSWHCHERSGHAGREHTIAELRLRYCICGARTMVRRLTSKCPTCRRLFSRPTRQRMGYLNRERTAVGEPPFKNVGIDCFSPFNTKSGRKINNRYGGIFSCLPSRAIHLEVLDSMDTNSFINALGRFISRRGHPQTICCDNGSNFVVAEKKLRQAIKGWSQDAIDSFLCKRDVQWKFTLPPRRISYRWSMGKANQGCAQVLSSVMVQREVSDDSLGTLMWLVESIVNIFPLTTVSEDPFELEPLTPNHPLLLRPAPLPASGVFDSKDMYIKRWWRQVQYLANLFWCRLVKEYLPLIQICPKWMEKQRTWQAGDIVLVVDYAARGKHWPLARVTDVSVGSDGLVRSAQVRTRTSTLTLPVKKLCLLQGWNEDFNDVGTVAVINCT